MYSIGRLVDSHNLPKGNNVMYWPDESMPSCSNDVDGRCSSTMAQRKTAETAKAVTVLLETKE